ncbi:MAG TPA: hypothetical protein DDW85_00105, partial [Porphyromonadaceae bacterium]|nr:hypothetical protein [Porphyromonadaceae bacterium]
MPSEGNAERYSSRVFLFIIITGTTEQSPGLFFGFERRSLPDPAYLSRFSTPKMRFRTPMAGLFTPAITFGISPAG